MQSRREFHMNVSLVNISSYQSIQGSRRFSDRCLINQILTIIYLNICYVSDLRGVHSNRQHFIKQGRVRARPRHEQHDFGHYATDLPDDS